MLVLGLLLLTIIPVSTLSAQDRPVRADSTETEIVELEMKDGSVFRGTILSETADLIAFRTLSGALIDVRPSDVLRRRVVSGRMTDSGFLQFDPNATRLLFGPTAESLTAGRGYVAVHELFLLSGAVGIGSSFTLWGGVSIIPGASEQLVFIAPKFTLLDRGKHSVAVGFALGSVTGNPDSGGIMYAATTFGGAEQALTVGTGFLFGGGEVLDSPIVMFGGHKQLSSRVKLLTENYAMPTEGGGVVVSGAVRFIGGRLTTDFGGITHSSVISEGGFPIQPWLSFSFQFGRD
ncbi:MAG: hypothetical protein O3C45_01580 [Bacteroidetes bacterium]|nr:hypothetical protein [Bacteroidota bacterium]